ncbi:hypothetical protein [Psychroflexus sediminis]|uniref:Transposase IS200 like n=1 Tax=Psychroflexus sediminis TaxID=470826 RepID=A0A1G7Z684_9FLAO|nr:hypothetical protein [Psychroflexus sediminis]SDH04109.1 hypothetical protein SAMN04488027_1195 [Psychroflexus sediminis]
MLYGKKNTSYFKKFAWQTGYAASESVVEKVYNYIKKQGYTKCLKPFQFNDTFHSPPFKSWAM